MSGMLFLFLGLVALKITIWQMGFLSGVLGTTQHDYSIAGFSLMAAIIFFGLWYAGRVNKADARTKFLSE